MTDPVPTSELYAFALDDHRQGVSRRADVEARAAHPTNTAQRHEDGSVTVTFPSGSSAHYTPITQEQARAIRNANGARTEAAAELGTALREALREAGLPIARWMQQGGQGIDVHTGGAHVSVAWWHATEAQRAHAARSGADPWEKVAARVREITDGQARERGLTVEDGGSSFSITLH